jgi:hypothetical protein
MKAPDQVVGDIAANGHEVEGYERQSHREDELGDQEQEVAICAPHFGLAVTRANRTGPAALRAFV